MYKKSFGVVIIIFDEIDYSEKGDFTRFYTKSKDSFDWDVKLEYKNPIKGVLKITEIKVNPMKKKGKGLGTWAYKSFEGEKKKKGVKEIKLTAGVGHWNSKRNKLASSFWEKMGFKTKSKPSGRPRRYRKVLGWL